MEQLVSHNLHENNLKFVNNVLREINKVISFTYGPNAGYISLTNEHISGFEYTKDGKTVLDNLKFNGLPETKILNVVRNVAHEIKENSGDGSTSAAKLLAYLVNNTENLYNIIDKENKETLRGLKIFRNNLPKVLDYTIDKILNNLKKMEIEHDGLVSNFMVTPDKVTYNDLEKVAFVSLNNDEELLLPFSELFRTLKEHEVPISDKIYIDAEFGDTERFKLSDKKGYALPVKSFSIVPVEKVENAKVLVTNNGITFDILYALSKFISMSCDFEQPVVFIVSSIEPESREHLKKIYTDLWKMQKSPKLFFLEMTMGRTVSMNAIEDITYLLSSNVVNFRENYLTWEHGIKDISVPSFTKAHEESTEIEDDNNFKSNILELLSKTNSCDIKRVGRDLILSVKNHVPSIALQKHIEIIKEQIESEDEEIASIARGRLSKLDSYSYTIVIPKRILGDGLRKSTAYSDAVKSINSTIKNGYVMGGNIAPYETIMTLINVHGVDNSKPSNNVLETEILKSLEEIGNIKNPLDVPKDKFSEVFLYLLAMSYRNIIDDILEHFSYDDMVDILNKKINGRTVLEPFETDSIVLRYAGYTFSNFVSNYGLLFDDPFDALKLNTTYSDNVLKSVYNPTSTNVTNINLVKNTSIEPIHTPEKSNVPFEQTYVNPPVVDTPVVEEPPVIEEPKEQPVQGKPVVRVVGGDAPKRDLTKILGAPQGGQLIGTRNI